MKPTFEPNQSQTGRAPASPVSRSAFQDDHPRLARVVAGQQLLFPANPRGLCGEIGLAWDAAVQLHEEGWLSFCPETTRFLDESQEAELRFVGALAVSGCDYRMLGSLLGGLTRPFAYDVRRLYFDWMERRWRLLPDLQVYPEAAFTDWLETLVQKGDVGSIAGIGELARDALARVHTEA